jgi:hypothetical protein
MDFAASVYFRLWNVRQGALLLCGTEPHLPCLQEVAYIPSIVMHYVTGIETELYCVSLKLSGSTVDCGR